MFGERLKELRTSKGISQEELGKRLGVTKQTVSNWEIENVTPSLDMFLNIVRSFNTTPNHMLGYETMTESAPDYSTAIADTVYRMCTENLSAEDAAAYMQTQMNWYFQ